MANAKRVRLFSIPLTLLLFQNNAFSADADEGWTIQSRVLSPPAAASQQLNSSLASTPQPNVAASSNYP